MTSQQLQPNTFPLRAVAGGMVALFLAFGVGRFAYTPLLPLMREQTGLALDLAGYLASLMYLGYLAGSIAVTRIISRVGPLPLLRGGLLLLTIACAAMPVGASFGAWALIMLAIGLSSAAIFLAALSLVLRVFLDYGAGWLTAILYAGIGTAIVIIGLAVPTIGQFSGWRAAWIFVALTALLGAIGCLWLLTPYARKNPVASSRVAEEPHPGARRGTAFLLSAYFLHGFAYTIGATFMVSILADFSGGRGNAALGWVLVGALVIPSCLLWPLIAARVGETRTSAVLLGLLALSNALVVLWPTSLGVLLAAGLFGSSFLAIPGLVLSRLAKLAGPRKDEITGFATIIFGIAMVLGPAVGGYLAKRSGSFDASLCLASLALCVAATSALLADKATRRQAAKHFTNALPAAQQQPLPTD